MASWDRDTNSDHEERDEYPTQVFAPPPPPLEITPDTEENVENETEELFQNFVYQRHRNENSQQNYSNIPVVPELVNFPSVPNSPAATIGRQLAKIGDDINEQYADTFNEMIHSLNIGPETAYEAFAGVAKKLFEDGTNWGRIITLLCFGYRIAMQVLKDHVGRFADFLRRITQYVIRFLVAEKISKWIADHGGWRAALSFKPSIDTRTFVTILSLAAISVICVLGWHRYCQL